MREYTQQSAYETAFILSLESFFYIYFINIISESIWNLNKVCFLKLILDYF